jgi:hypothetical protein
MGEHLTQKDIEQLNHEMVLAGLENTELIIRQNKDITADLKEDLSGTLREQVKSGILEEMFTKNREELEAKTQEIETLKLKLHSLYGDSVPGYVLRKEVHTIYPEIQSNYFATIEHSLNGNSDTIPTVFIRWKEGTRSRTKKDQSEKLAKWLAVRLNMDTIRVLEY